MTELHHPTINMFQSTVITESNGDKMKNRMESRNTSTPLIDLGHMGPEYIPPPPCVPHETSIHPQINNLEDHPIQELHPELITPKQHTSYQL